MKRVLALILVLILCATLFIGCEKKNADGRDDVIAKIGDTEITQAYYNFIYNMLYTNMAQYEQYYGADWINMQIEEGKTIGDFLKENTYSQV